MEGITTFAIVEDEPIESMAMEQFICRSFQNVRVIWKREDGESALDAVHRERPDILIVDIEMPLIARNYIRNSMMVSF